MKNYALLGYPLGHTMSPPIHRRLFQLEGIPDGDYRLFEVPPEELAAKAGELNALDGYNVTIPYKMDIIQYLDRLDDSAKRYNSVNCVKDKAGYNTDCSGFLRSLEAAGGSLSGKVLQIGCGGVGRMMAIEAALHGAELTIVALPEFVPGAEAAAEEARKLAPGARISVITHDRIAGEFDLLMNASPVGMFPKVDECPVAENVVKRCGMVFDVIYNPGVTRLMEIAQSCGIRAVGGMAMLVWQAAVAHEIWNGTSFRDEDINLIIADMKAELDGIKN